MKPSKIRRAVEAVLGSAPAAFLYDGKPLPGSLRAQGPLTIEAAGATKRFKGLAYSGGPLTLKDYPVPVVVDLAGVTVEAQSLPMFKDHDPGNQIASSDAITVDLKAGITVSGEIDASKPDGELIVAAGKGGLAWELSIGAPVQAMESFGKGEKVTVNGRTFTGPLLVARKTTLKEVSFVRRGADVGQTHVAIAASLKGKNMDEKFLAYIAAAGFDPATLTDVQKAALQKAYDAENPKAAPPIQAAATPAAAPAAPDLKAFAKQLQASFQIEAMLKGHDDIRAMAFNEDGELKADWSKGRIEDAIALKEIRAARPTGPYIVPGISSVDSGTKLEILQAALILRSGGQLDNPAYASPRAAMLQGLPTWLKAGLNTDQRQRVMDAAHAFADMSSVDFCRQCVALDGRHVPSSRQEVIRAAFSGSTFSNVFTTSMYAQVVSGFMQAPDTTAGWTQSEELTDFKTNDEIRLTTLGGVPKKLPRGTEAQHITRSDEIESYKINRYAAQFVADEQDAIDDRFGVILQQAPDMGAWFASIPQDLVYAIILSNPTLGATSVALFSDSNSPDNLRATSALTDTNLKAAIPQMMLAQENSRNLSVIPTHLIVPPSLMFTAATLMNSSAMITGNTTPVGNANVLQNLLTVVTEARLENGVTSPDTGTTSSGSATSWYLAAAGSQGVRTIKRLYRAGTGRAPQVRSFTLSEGKWGMGWDINFDTGAKAMDFRGLQKNTA